MFLHPWAILWIGLPAVGLPVAIHFLTRPRPVRMPLSTLRFVREAIRQRRARHRLRDILLLMLRVAAVLLLALAVARPQRGRQADVARRERHPGDTVRVVILDVSQSMAATDGRIEAIERARTTAAGFLRYQPRLRANLIVAAAKSRGVFQGASTNFDLLRDELGQCRVRPQRLDVAKALDLAAPMLAPASKDDPRRFELVIVSDFQRSNWADVDFSLVPEKTEIRLESIAPPMTPANLAIVSASFQRRRSTSRELTWAVEVGNFSQATRTVTVEAQVDGKTYRLDGPCPPGETTRLSREIRLDRQGWLWGRTRLLSVDDALAADDVRWVTTCIRPKPVHALITRQPAAARPSSSHFLECGLVPDLSQGEKATSSLVRLAPSKIDRGALAVAALIVLEHPGKLDREAIHLLADLMRRGRSILYVAAEPIDATNLKLLVEAAGSGLQMPVEFMPPPTGRPRRDLFLTTVNRRQPPFAVFGDSLPVVTRGLRFSGGLASRRLQDGLPDDILAGFGDGSAAITLTTCGAGYLGVLNADLAASTLPKTPAFVPLLQELVERMLARNDGQESHVCGGQFVVQLPGSVESAAGLKIVGADGPLSLNAGRLTEESLGVIWRWPDAGPPGAYQAQRNGECVFVATINVPADEADLESLSARVLAERLSGGRELYYHQAGEPGDSRDDLWMYYLTACVIMMLAEVAAMLAFRT